MSNRTKNVIKSSGFAFLEKILSAFLKFSTRGIFVFYLGIEYVGLQNLLISIVGFLSIAELGFGSAINHALYKSLAKKNRQNIVSLLAFYQKAYLFIATMIVVFGVILTPIIPLVVKNSSSFEYIYLIYALFVCSSVIGYLFPQKRPLLRADQRQFIISRINIATQSSTIVFQVVAVIVINNPSEKLIAMLLVDILHQIINNVWQNIKANHLYSNLSEITPKAIDKDQKRGIVRNVLGGGISTIAWNLGTGLDTAMLTFFSDLKLVGCYANYTILTNTIKQLFKSLIAGVVPGIGQSGVMQSKNERYEIFKKYFFIIFVFTLFVSSVFFACVNPLVSIWLSDEFVITGWFAFFVTLELSIIILLNIFNDYISAFGLQWKMKLFWILEGILNLGLTFAFLFAFKLGPTSVVLGTFLSVLVFSVYPQSKVIFREVFSVNSKEFYKMFTKYFGLVLFSLGLISIIQKFLLFNLSVLVQLVLGMLISVFISSVLVIPFCRTNEFIYFKKLLFDIIKKRI